MKEIPFTSIKDIRVGQVENAQAGTGVTVMVAPGGMAAGIDVRGGGPASRDTRTLDPLAAAERIHAIVLGGGSAYGLDAAGGVMRNLEERGIGLTVLPGLIVPLVCQSDIFDLGVGAADVRPTAEMGYAACSAAFEGETGNYQDGNFGAGCGATVGKMAGPSLAMKSGIGSAAIEVGNLQVGALVVVNACGDIYDSRTGEKIAGARSPQSSCQLMYAALEAGQNAQEQAALAAPHEAHKLAAPGEGAGANTGADTAGTGTDAAGNPGMPTNTTIGIVVTNASFTKAQLCKLAGMAHDGYARAIRPVHTSMDGDSIYGVSVAREDAPAVEASLDIVGSLAADVMERAIRNACYSAAPAFGLPSAQRNA